RRQGDNGDWYVSPCDRNSVMNYCAGEWHNNGMLSAGDIKVLRYFYGHPSNRSIEHEGPQVVYTSELYKVRDHRKKHKKDTLFRIKLYVVATDSVLNEIEEVDYYLLHKTFRRARMSARSVSDRFGIGLIVWGEFRIFVDVQFKDETFASSVHRIEFLEKYKRRESVDDDG